MRPTLREAVCSSFRLKAYLPNVISVVQNLSGCLVGDSKVSDHY
jgi:hypothetical protein